MLLLNSTACPRPRVQPINRRLQAQRIAANIAKLSGLFGNPDPVPVLSTSCIGLDWLWRSSQRFNGSRGKTGHQWWRLAMLKLVMLAGLMLLIVIMTAAKADI
jgi:hypothetical protein